MTEAISPTFLAYWSKIGTVIALGGIVIGLLFLLSYYFKLMSLKEYKEKYDYINLREIKVLGNGILVIIVSLTIWVNTGKMLEVLRPNWIFFFVTLFVSSMLAMIIMVIIQNVLKFYYPFYIEKRLKKLRYTPRISPDGREMKLLSEEEEDVYLNEGMQAEEDVFSVDYDVWIDEESGFTKIEKYNGRLHALECSSCNYQTLKVEKEELIKEATTVEEGELIKHYKCGYCGNREVKTLTLPVLD